MQRLSGNGTVFLEFDGHIKEYELAPGQQIVVDTGYLAAMTAGCTIDIQTVPGVKICSLAEKESLIPSSPDRDVYGCRACRLHSSPEQSARLFQIKINLYIKIPEPFPMLRDFLCSMHFHIVRTSKLFFPRVFTSYNTLSASLNSFS